MLSTFTRIRTVASHPATKGRPVAWLGAALLSTPWLAGTAQAQAPTLTSQTPAPNQLAVSRNAAVSASFSQPLSNAAATLGALRVFSQQAGGRKAGAATVSGSTLSFVPTTAFRPGETVSATLTTAVQGSGGAGLAQPRVFQFTTATTPGPGTFGTSPAVAVGSGAARVVVGDVNGDGDPDLLTANSGTTAVSVRLNNGAGVFSGSQEVPVGVSAFGGSPARGLALGDVDGDGDLDLVATTVSGSTSVRLNNGTGTFGAGQDVDLGQSWAVALGDVDGDGDLDLLVTTGVLGGRVNVRLNNGSGTFSGGQFVDVGAFPRSLTLGDLDGDGDLDLVTSGYDAGITTPGYNPATTGVSVRYNDGLGNYNGSQQVQTGGYIDDVKLADVDGDRDLDLLAASLASSKITVLPNDGAGAFGRAQQVDLGSSGPSSLEVADLDGDGDLDLLAASQNTRTLSVRLNGGTGTFANAPNAYLDNGAAALAGAQEVALTGQLPGGLAVADVNGDGRLDLLATTSGTLGSQVAVRLSQQALASVVPAAAPIGSRLVLTGTDLSTTASVTFNASALGLGGAASPAVATNFVVNSPTQLTVTVPPGATSGVLVVTSTAGVSSSVLFTVAAPLALSGLAPARTALAVARTAAVATTFAQAPGASATGLGLVRVFSQQAGGLKAGSTTASGNTLSLQPTTAFKAGETVLATVTAADRATSQQVFQFTTATTPSTGTFSGGSEVAVDGSPQSIALGDIDGDGDLDLLAASPTISTVSVRRNNGQGVFDGAQVVGIGGADRRLVLGDIDSDGDLDLLASTGDNTVSVRRNNGQGLFSNTQELPIGAGRGLTLGDVDGDGDLDLLTAAGTLDDSRVTVSLNNGGGVFSNSGSVLVGDNPQRPVLGDVDGDGDLDLLVNNFSLLQGNNASVRLNNGNGFVYNTIGGPQPTVGAGGYVDDVKLADIDADGDLDLLAVSFSSSKVSIRRNNGQGAFSGTQELDLGARGPVALEVADIDGDGDLDLLTANQNSRTVGVRLNDGQGNFSGSQEVALAGQAPTSLALGDLDGDGDLDLLATQPGNNTVSVRFNQNNTPQSLSSLAPSATVGWQVYPNPSQGAFQVQYVASQGQAATLLLSDQLGRVVQQQQVRLQAGLNQLAVEARGIAPGLYQLVLRPALDPAAGQKVSVQP